MYCGSWRSPKNASQLDRGNQGKWQPSERSLSGCNDRKAVSWPRGVLAMLDKLICVAPLALTAATGADQQ
jgi:hypothetical protein